MEIDGKTIWQVAAGNGAKTHYAKLCLEQDVIILGPGRYGPWPYCEQPMRDNGWTSRKIGINRLFAEQMKPGNIVVLRVGTQHVYGVGELVGKYGFSEMFGKVQGWDLQHFRRVRWLWHQDGEPETFPVYALNLGNSVQHLTSPQVRQWLEGLDIPTSAYMKSLKALADETISSGSLDSPIAQHDSPAVQKSPATNADTGIRGLLSRLLRRD